MVFDLLIQLAYLVFANVSEGSSHLYDLHYICVSVLDKKAPQKYVVVLSIRIADGVELEKTLLQRAKLPVVEKA